MGKRTRRLKREGRYVDPYVERRAELDAHWDGVLRDLFSKNPNWVPPSYDPSEWNEPQEPRRRRRGAFFRRGSSDAV